MGPEVLRPSLQALIAKDNTDWNSNSRLCSQCLDRYRGQQMQHLLEEEKGDLSSLDEEVLRSLQEQELITKNSEADFTQKLTLGETLSDRVATFGGSWSFLIFFAIFMAAWIGFNNLGPRSEEFDPYPYILLNLILSCLAAIQAPVIMMSQNRQEAKDRLRGENDYRVNLKAELEIRQLHMKIDQLLKHQWRRLLEIQQLQMEMMNESLKRSKTNSAATDD